MAWVTTPPTQTAASRTGWVTSPTTKPSTPPQGWLGAGTVTINARPSGSGQLTLTTVARPFIAALLAGSGALAASVAKREMRNAALTGDGVLAAPYGQYLPAFALFSGTGTLSSPLQSNTVYPQFSGDGVLAGYEDGLSAVVVPGVSLAALFAGNGSLQGVDQVIALLNIQFGGQGVLAAVFGPALPAFLSGSGQLSAAAFSGVFAQLLGSGQLSAIGVLTYPRAAGFTGPGSLTGLFLQKLIPPQGGTGTVSALVSQRYAVTAALSGAGALAAGFYASFSTTFAGSGSGTLSAPVIASYACPATLSGTGTLSATAVQAAAHYTDNFNRPNSSTLGAAWTNRLNTMGIDTNAAIPTSSGNRCMATYNSVMLTNDHQATFTVGTLNTVEQGCHTIIGSNTTGEGAHLEVPNGGKPIIVSRTTWNGGTVRATATSNTTFTVGDTYTLRRVGNVYTGLKNGTAIAGCTWTDGTNIVPRDANHLLVGIGEDDTNGFWRRLDAWAADDI